MNSLTIDHVKKALTTNLVNSGKELKFSHKRLCYLEKISMINEVYYSDLEKSIKLFVDLINSLVVSNSLNEMTYSIKGESLIDIIDNPSQTLVIDGIEFYDFYDNKKRKKCFGQNFVKNYKETNEIRTYVINPETFNPQDFANIYFALNIFILPMKISHQTLLNKEFREWYINTLMELEVIDKQEVTINVFKEILEESLIESKIKAKKKKNFTNLAIINEKYLVAGEESGFINKDERESLAMRMVSLGVRREKDMLNIPFLPSLDEGYIGDIQQIMDLIDYAEGRDTLTDNELLDYNKKYLTLFSNFFNAIEINRDNDSQKGMLGQSNLLIKKLADNFIQLILESFNSLGEHTMKLFKLNSCLFDNEYLAANKEYLINEISKVIKKEDFFEDLSIRGIGKEILKKFKERELSEKGYSLDDNGVMRFLASERGIVVLGKDYKGILIDNLNFVYFLEINEQTKKHESLITWINSVANEDIVITPNNKLFIKIENRCSAENILTILKQSWKLFKNEIDDKTPLAQSKIIMIKKDLRDSKDIEKNKNLIEVLEEENKSIGNIKVQHKIKKI